MTETTNHSQATDLVARYLAGEMDAGEKLNFEQMLLEDQDLSSEFKAAKEAWELMEYFSSGTLNEIDTDKAWGNLSTRFADDVGEDMAHQTPSVFQMPVWLKWAAAVLLVAGLGWATYLGWMRSAEESLLVFENTDQEMVSVKTLHDGSLVYLAKQSQIYYPEFFDATARKVKMAGEAFFDVAPDAQKPFTIEAGNATIEVVGTSFNVKTLRAGTLELFVEEGRVKVWFDNSRKESVMVSEGQLLMLENGLAEVVFPSHYNTQWRKNLLQFKDERLGNILFALSKTYGITFETENDAIKNRIMTVTIYDGSLETISELIALSLSLDYEITGDSHVVFRSPK
jgi:ferric-dicitrate binding protein FerR (iron transport regulator)